ncbi:MAG TPA: histidine kinase dimerization/phosphoacceptor domain -containing protein, partial [Bacteroidia bacterium]|nr:histidine kinase dimerization/phosphoacceptor domain -containing protein [Bacteroidia bacterium]
IEGKMAGVICFEDTERTRRWDISERRFALFIAQLIAQAIETDRKRNLRKDLEQALGEKKVILAELNHRVKNNFSLMGEIVKAQEEHARDEYHRNLFIETRSRLHSLSMIHQQLYRSESTGSVNFRDFLLDLAAQFRNTFSGNNLEISTLLQNVSLPVTKAALAGLLVDEMLSVICKKIIPGKERRMIIIQLNTIGNLVNIRVRSDQPGIRTDENEIMKALLLKMDAECTTGTDEGSYYAVSFPLNQIY